MPRIGTGGNGIEGFEHLFDILHMAIGQNQGQITGRRLGHRRPNEAALNPFRRRPATVEEITERWTMTPPPKILAKLAIYLPYLIGSWKGSVNFFDTKMAKLVFSLFLWA